MQRACNGLNDPFLWLLYFRGLYIVVQTSLYCSGLYCRGPFLIVPSSRYYSVMNIIWWYLKVLYCDEYFLAVHQGIIVWWILYGGASSYYSVMNMIWWFLIVVSPGYYIMVNMILWCLTGHIIWDGSWHSLSSDNILWWILYCGSISLYCCGRFW